MMHRTCNKLSTGRRQGRPTRLALKVQATTRPTTAQIQRTGIAATLASLVQAAPALAAVEEAAKSAVAKAAETAQAAPAKVAAQAASTVQAAPPPPPPPAPPAPPSDIDIDSAVDTLIAAVKAAGGAVKTGVSAVGPAVDAVKQGYTTAEPYLKQALESTVKNVQDATPYVAQALESTQKAVEPYISQTVPVVQDTVNQVVSPNDLATIKNIVTPVFQVAAGAVAFVIPIAGAAVRFIGSTPPDQLGQYALGAFGVYLVGPRVLGFVGDRLRGYAGEISAAAAVDLLLANSATLVDLRTPQEKEASGIPDLPSNVKDRVQEVEFTQTDDRRLRGLLKNPTNTETEVTALQVAALKRINKGTMLLLLDRNGNTAKAVAKQLTAMGYRKVYVIPGGFDGRKGWVQSKLQIKPVAVEFEASGSNKMLAGLGRIGTRGTRKEGTRGSRKQLPAPR